MKIFYVSIGLTLLANELTRVSSIKAGNCFFLLQCLWIVFGLINFQQLSAKETNPKFLEYQVKAGYLYNFTKFVTWPELTHDAFNICLLGNEPFGKMIDPIEKKSVAGIPIRLIRLPKYDHSKECRMLFISRSNKRTFDLANFPDGLLTVSDQEHFINRGGMVELVVIDERVRLKINLDACRKKNLKISAKLLELVLWDGD